MAMKSSPKRHFIQFGIILLLVAIGVGYYLTRPDVAKVPLSATEGVEPQLKNARKQVIPTVNIAEVDRWQKDQAPTAPKGYKVQRFADGLTHPRQMLTLPNGDVLVAETNRPDGEDGGLMGTIMGYFYDKAGAGTPSPNRITLLRDENKDGIAETRKVFAIGLNSPFGMAFAHGYLFVANNDAVVYWPFEPGQTSVKGKPKTLMSLPAGGAHWTRNLALDPDKNRLFIAIGSSSNIAENGMDAEAGRARIIQYNIKEKKRNGYSKGLRNPVGMDWNPWRDGLWAVVNERDMLGSDMVPDYLTEIPMASDFGWPHHYWGGYTDERVSPREDETRRYERRPDYGLGAHTAPLGLLFTDGLSLNGKFGHGAFVARHGSWNRVPASGYDVVYVRFDDKGEPVGLPVEFLTGFLTKDGKARGRPTMLAPDQTGALLVSDDVGNVIWRVSRSGS